MKILDKIFKGKHRNRSRRRVTGQRIPEAPPKPTGLTKPPSPSDVRRNAAAR